MFAEKSFTLAGGEVAHSAMELEWKRLYVVSRQHVETLRLILIAQRRTVGERSMPIAQLAVSYESFARGRFSAYLRAKASRLPIEGWL